MPHRYLTPPTSDVEAGSDANEDLKLCQTGDENLPLAELTTQRPLATVSLFPRSPPGSDISHNAQEGAEGRPFGRAAGQNVAHGSAARDQYSYRHGQRYAGDWSDCRQQYTSYTPLSTSLATPTYGLNWDQHHKYGPFIPQPLFSYSHSAGKVTAPQVSSKLSATATAFVPPQQTQSVHLPVLDRFRRIDKDFRYNTKTSDTVSTPANREKPKKLSKKQRAAARAREQAGTQSHSLPVAAPNQLRQTTLLDFIKKVPHETPEAPKPKRRYSGAPRLHVMERPKPTPLYMQLASQPPKQRSAPQALLVVVDLNGTLLKRLKHSGSNKSKLRPHINDFLDYILANHKLMIWSSARPENVEVMCSKLFTPEQREKLVTIWARDRLRLTLEAYNAKVQVYKQLSWIWKDKSIQTAHPVKSEIWSQANTVLIDDSIAKAASEPYNLIEVEEFEGSDEQIGTDTYLLEAKAYLQTLSLQTDVSAYMRARPFKHSAAPQVSSLDPEKTSQATTAPQHVFFKD
ncbi:uncharacterized protein RHO25_004645 [Cercospora beticola]|uniref:Mitochondrial import inner membrane translocase subunit TIM50 n=1 Tax=Cercospora beticola TaxID=122368 RepID=A0ABZ0NKJ2_CERBT|nr:hypothetical protein RHO25_004645 [Cercospora beticola]